MKIFTPLGAALGFMTRLVPAKTYDDEIFGATLKYFPVVGLIIGLLATGPFWLGFLRGHAWLQAWVLLGMSLYITRGLHWDGWADLFDAWGSGAQGDRFWEILKDSHIGAFGVIGLIMGLVGELFLLRGLLQAGAYEAIVLAFVLGRSAAMVTAFAGRRLARSSGLGRTFMAGATVPVLFLVLAQTVVLGLFVKPLAVLALGLVLCLGGVLELRALAHRAGGMNGDFLGAAVIWGELCGLVAWTIVSAIPISLSW